MNTVPIDDEAVSTFRDRGLIRLPALVPASVVTPVRDEAYEVLERFGAAAAGRWVADHADEALAGRIRRSLKERMKASKACRDLETELVRAAVLTLLGGVPIRSITDRPQLLFTPPDASEWSVPHRVWHLDVPRLAQAGCPGVQTFCCIDTVSPGGGGTVVVAGSHRLLNDQGRIASRDVKRKLAGSPWFKTLFRPGTEDRSRTLLGGGEVEDATEGAVRVQVVELTGDPGDVYLVDLRTLHSLAANTSARPRLTATQRYLREAVADEVYAADMD